MVSKAAQHQIEKVQDLLSMISGSGGAFGVIDEGRSSSPAATLYVPPSGRVLSKRVSEVSVDSDGLPTLLPDVSSKKGSKQSASSSSNGSKRKLALADAMAMAAAHEDLEGCELVIADMDALAELDEEEAKIFAASKAAPSGGQGSASVPLVKARRVSDDAPGKYTVMYYKQNNSFGVRQLFDKKRQIISICKRGQTKEVLQVLADDAKGKLNKGQEESEVKSWVKGKLDAM